MSAGSTGTRRSRSPVSWRSRPSPRAGAVRGQDFDCDPAVQAAIAGFVNFAHAPGTQGALDLMRTQARAAGERSLVQAADYIRVRVASLVLGGDRCCDLGLTIIGAADGRRSGVKACVDSAAVSKIDNYSS